MSTTGLTAINSSQPAVLSRDDSEAPWVVGRLELWRVAVTLIARHPLLGLGPDNFRHYYGAELGLDNWDERVQANNLYLELLVDLGVLGLAAFGWIVARAVRIGSMAVQGVAESTRFEAEQSTSPAPIGADQVSSRVASAGHHSSGPVHIGATPSSGCLASAGEQSSGPVHIGANPSSSCLASAGDQSSGPVHIGATPSSGCLASAGGPVKWASAHRSGPIE